MAIVVESSHNLRKAMDADVARDRVSMASTVRVMKMTPRVLPHVSELEITRSWKYEGVMTLTMAYFCEDMENFNDWSVSTGAIVESVDDNLRDIDRPSLLSHSFRDFQVEPTTMFHKAEAFEAEHQ